MGRFDLNDGDFLFDVGDGMMMDTQGHMMHDMGSGMAMDMQTGEMHLTSGGDNSLVDDDEDEWLI